jgi:hypothetical protein|nr:MAG TPA: hypothetical protein [Caudoviricetes sp.]
MFNADNTLELHGLIGGKKNNTMFGKKFKFLKSKTISSYAKTGDINDDIMMYRSSKEIYKLNLNDESSPVLVETLTNFYDGPNIRTLNDCFVAAYRDSSRGMYASIYDKQGSKIGELSKITLTGSGSINLTQPFQDPITNTIYVIVNLGGARGLIGFKANGQLVTNDFLDYSTYDLITGGETVVAHDGYIYAPNPSNAMLKYRISSKEIVKSVAVQSAYVIYNIDPYANTMYGLINRDLYKTSDFTAYSDRTMAATDEMKNYKKISNGANAKLSSFWSTSKGLTIEINSTIDTSFDSMYNSHTPQIRFCQEIFSTDAYSYTNFISPSTKTFASFDNNNQIMLYKR